ncbi:hypothetical protein GWO43_20615, partial [candidate division KSB1 bacterium]|nr:hypothetical protein [candidate division KSB1 bacterium]NIS26472.1 hypothetical protein [candidate division KSB1 bacterium]NIT73238.1 hypothetical protein [candidate division KSB1 bacterium]NIU27156.1 hypothetical protein [candidate division KSB1 bacterium]NIV95777.1 hypothetical protein [candidate division KSB1 bacterium]
IQSQIGLAVEEEFPGDLIPLPNGYQSRARNIDNSRLKLRHLHLFHFDPYSVAFRYIARGDEPDYHVALYYLRNGWIEIEEMERLLAELLPRFSMETIQQDPAEFRRKYKGLLQMWKSVQPGA